MRYVVQQRGMWIPRWIDITGGYTDKADADDYADRLANGTGMSRGIDQKWHRNGFEFRVVEVEEADT